MGDDRCPFIPGYLNLPTVFVFGQDLLRPTAGEAQILGEGRADTGWVFLG